MGAILGGANILGGAAQRSAPGYQNANLDPGTAALIQQQASHSNEDPSQLTSEQMRGVNNPNDVTGALAQSQRINGALGGDNSLSAALAQRANNLYGFNENQVGNQVAAYTPMMQANLLNTASSNLNKNAAMQGGFYQRQAQQNLDASNARNSVISSLMGGAGQIGGAMAGKYSNSPASAATTSAPSSAPIIGSSDVSSSV